MLSGQEPTDDDLLRVGLVRKAALKPKSCKYGERRRIEALEVARKRFADSHASCSARAQAVPDIVRREVKAAYEATHDKALEDDFFTKAMQSHVGVDVFGWMISGWIEKAGQIAAEKKMLGAAIVGERDAQRRRLLRVRLATPRWADFCEIASLIAERDRATEATGVAHHVDHIYPLAGKLVCGLHVHTNMRVIPASDNLRKNNAMPLESEAVFM